MVKFRGIILTILVLVHWSNAATLYIVHNVQEQENMSASSSGMRMMPGISYDPSQGECGGATSNRRSMLQQDMKQDLRLSLKHRDEGLRTLGLSPKLRLTQSIRRDGARRSSLVSRTESKNISSVSRNITSGEYTVESRVQSGASLGSGEYFMDALFGTPPIHLSLIIDTGSDLTWTQCAPCRDCFPQQGEIFNPASSSSYSPISCASRDCNLVAPPRNYTCTTDSCRYFYSYGDASNTTGDLARETMLLKLGEMSSSHDTGKPGGNRRGVEIEGLIFGCGHENKGLFRGASGLLGLGRGPLSVTSQLGWQKFAYCLVDRNSNLSVSSSISFGHDFALARHGGQGAFRYTPFVSGGVDTFYYLDVRAFRTSNDTKVVEGFLRVSQDGIGGLIIDSGTTLTYLTRPAYDALETLLLAGIGYPRTDAFEVLDVCFNTSSSSKVLLPGLNIVFGNGEEMELSASNLFIQPDSEEPVYCLAVLPTDGRLSILGNYQQQNMHLLYDAAGPGARLGFLTTDCARL